MNSIKKIEILNKAAIVIREQLTEINNLFKDDKDIPNLVWRVNKHFNELQKEICKALDKEVTKDEFDNIIKGFEK